MARAKSRSRKSKPSGLRKYWPHLTLKECEVERQKMADAQGDRCAICGKHESQFKSKLAIDHSHVSGRVRGLLCYPHNRFLVGKQTIESASRLLLYLLRYDIPLLKGQEIETCVEELKERLLTLLGDGK